MMAHRSNRVSHVEAAWRSGDKTQLEVNGAGVEGVAGGLRPRGGLVGGRVDADLVGATGLSAA